MFSIKSWQIPYNEHLGSLLNVPIKFRVNPRWIEFEYMSQYPKPKFIQTLLKSTYINQPSIIRISQMLSHLPGGNQIVAMETPWKSNMYISECPIETSIFPLKPSFYHCNHHCPSKTFIFSLKKPAPKNCQEHRCWVTPPNNSNLPPSWAARNSTLRPKEWRAGRGLAKLTGELGRVEALTSLT